MFIELAPAESLLILLQITSEHPQIETITPDGLSKKFFDGVRYDLLVTFSSIEHSGLGRYMVCHGLDKQSKMIIFESILTAF